MCSKENAKHGLKLGDICKKDLNPHRLSRVNNL